MARSLYPRSRSPFLIIDWANRGLVLEEQLSYTAQCTQGLRCMRTSAPHYFRVGNTIDSSHDRLAWNRFKLYHAGILMNRNSLIRFKLLRAQSLSRFQRNHLRCYINRGFPFYHTYTMRWLRSPTIPPLSDSPLPLEKSSPLLQRE